MDTNVIKAWDAKKEELQQFFEKGEFNLTLEGITEAICNIVFEKGEVIPKTEVYLLQEKWKSVTIKTSHYVGTAIILFVSESDLHYVSYMNYGSCEYNDAIEFVSHITCNKKRVSAIMAICLHIIQKARPLFTDDELSKINTYVDDCILSDVEKIAGNDTWGL